jgi:hypothetical protein
VAEIRKHTENYKCLQNFGTKTLEEKDRLGNVNVNVK